MSEYLYRFGFETPVQKLANAKYGWDDENSYSFFIEAESAEQALEWGREVSEEFIHFMYRHLGWKEALPSWKEDGYAHWIVDDPDDIKRCRDWGVPQVVVGEMPDISRWPRVI